MSRRAAQKLTKRFIDDLEPGKKGGTWYGDADLPGLYVVSYPTGAKVFIVRFLAARRRRAVVVGKYGVLTLEKARQKAKRLLSDATLGGDPATARDRARKTPRPWTRATSPRRSTASAIRCTTPTSSTRCAARRCC